MDTQFWHNLEVVVISFVIIYQLIHTVIVSRSTLSLKNVFSSKLFIRTAYIDKKKIGNIDLNSSDIFYEDEFDREEAGTGELNELTAVKISLIDTTGNHEIIKTIKIAINTYLINNYGAAVNFSIIKDIVDREVEVKDDEITQSITLPLYLGLAATMIGIIFGLFSMPELKGDGFTIGVNALIDGVKIAMIGSLTGLALTTFLSSFLYKSAKRKVQKEKNEQLTYLQAKLLPELIKAEDTGVSGLKASLDRFAREATTISDRVLTAANQTRYNLELQKEVINKVEKMKVIKVSKWNLELFDKLESNMEVFNNFITYLSSMERIASQLTDFASKTSNVNMIINGIDNSLKESRDLTKFLTTHFEKIENAGEAALKAVGIAESHFEEAIKQLNTRTDEAIKQLSKSAGNHENNIENIYKEIETNLKTITNEYVSAFKEAFEDSMPKLKHLDNLEFIKEIDISVKSMNKDQTMANRLLSIEEVLRNQQARSNGTKSSTQKSQKTDNQQKIEAVSLRKVVKELFKEKKQNGYN